MVSNLSPSSLSSSSQQSIPPPRKEAFKTLYNPRVVSLARAIRAAYAGMKSSKTSMHLARVRRIHGVTEEIGKIHETAKELEKVSSSCTNSSSFDDGFVTLTLPPSPQRVLEKAQKLTSEICTLTDLDRFQDDLRSRSNSFSATSLSSNRSSPSSTRRKLKMEVENSQRTMRFTNNSKSFTEYADFLRKEKQDAEETLLILPRFVEIFLEQEHETQLDASKLPISGESIWVPNAVLKDLHRSHIRIQDYQLPKFSSPETVNINQGVLFYSHLCSLNLTPAEKYQVLRLCYQSLLANLSTNIWSSCTCANLGIQVTQKATRGREQENKEQEEGDEISNTIYNIYRDQGSGELYLIATQRYEIYQWDEFLPRDPRRPPSQEEINPKYSIAEIIGTITVNITTGNAECSKEFSFRDPIFSDTFMKQHS